MPRNSTPIISPLFRYVCYNEDQWLFVVHNPTKNIGIKVDTPPTSYLEFATIGNMKPDILGALSVVTDGKDWDLPAIPLSRKDMDLSAFAVDGRIIDPDLDALGFYKNGHLDMDQVNHHVCLTLDRLHCYDNKGPSHNNCHGQGFNPFKVTTNASHTPTIMPMAPINEPSMAQPVPAVAPASIALPSAPATMSTSTTSSSTPTSAPAPATSISVTTCKAAAVHNKDKKGTNMEDAIMGDANAA
ncbi:uncharacterized protein LACBIDRAFT_325299 [Laccaria bicolor S238N-H82]|uniref:Predicted protein n=1 Tax=Laccaria bicolor (strain S238N-H82 / ATCC MYA-4686) TaxID=486041 RepID=B0D4G7_LACBS|nr:uncharacterized protein LACBIDRAFT_325299 [Laccaria bicolor S238N-H82]EDR10560.1 predicted protein [Laccaria bicolor S238N-H82]|eukprot:XP_001879010.1 predicted protein [Laccaria bicolor S238N-H82]